MNRNRETRQLAAMIDAIGHQTSAPPPNEKKDKKKLDAAKAIERCTTPAQYRKALVELAKEKGVNLPEPRAALEPRDER